MSAGNSIKTVGYVLVAMFFVAAVVLSIFVTVLNAPANATYPLSFEIEEGTSARAVSEQMKDLGLVRSSTFFYVVLVSLFDPTEIKASEYRIVEPLSTTALVELLIQGDFNNDLIRLTHIEGETVEKLAKRAASVLPAFDENKFVSRALPDEGKMFPDTYFIPETYTEEQLYNLLLLSFEDAIAPFEVEIEQSELTLNNVLVLASIIEREANTGESMRLVSSVLQNRISIGMPLQADASIEYILDKPLKLLTPEDLEIDSPYNTYVNPGLPPTPIGNPGITSILAVLRPVESDYFYYITDDNGDFYFSKTYSEHLQNIDRYLR